jgi:hypothetical protein
MNFRTIDFRVERVVWSDLYDVYARVQSDGQARALSAEVIREETVPAGGMWPKFLSLDSADAQSLMNALWNAGLRPANGESSMAHVDAMKAHLQDMRKIAFEALHPLQSVPAPQYPQDPLKIRLGD